MPFRKSDEGGYCVFQLGLRTEVLLVNKLSSLVLTLESNKRKEKIRGVTKSKPTSCDARFEMSSSFVSSFLFVTSEKKITLSAGL